MQPVSGDDDSHLVVGLSTWRYWWDVGYLGMTRYHNVGKYDNVGKYENVGKYDNVCKYDNVGKYDMTVIFATRHCL